MGSPEVRNSNQWIDYAATALVIVAYVPQVRHPVRERCSAGVSVGAYALWPRAALLLLSYATLRQDPVFTPLQFYQVAATGTICFYAKKYRGSLCEIHGGRT